MRGAALWAGVVCLSAPACDEPAKVSLELPRVQKLPLEVRVAEPRWVAVFPLDGGAVTVETGKETIRLELTDDATGQAAEPVRRFRQDAKFNDHDAVVVPVDPARPEVEIVLAHDDVAAVTRKKVIGVRPGRPGFLFQPWEARRSPKDLGIPGMEELPPDSVMVPTPDVKFGANGEFLLPPTFEAILGTLWIPPETLDDDLSLLVPEVGLTPREPDLELAPGGAIRGRVVPLAAPNERARVFAIGPGSYELPASVKEDGTFVLRGLPKGRWHIEALVSGQGRTRRGSTEAETGSDVVIETK